MLNISEAARYWVISRTTIHNKIKAGELSKTPDGKIDPAEMSRVFGHPKRKIEHKKNVQVNTIEHSNEQYFTLQKQLFEQQIEQERQLRIEANRRADEMKERAEQAEAREKYLLQQMTNLTETIKLLEAPKTEHKMRKKWFGIF
jgi:hypothetical protein